jgi:hypothetical protein
MTSLNGARQRSRIAGRGRPRAGQNLWAERWLEPAGQWQRMNGWLMQRPSENIERCPHCRMRRDGYAVFRCPACGLSFCAGCDGPELPARGLGWLEAAADEAAPILCPACTQVVADDDQIGFIGGPLPADETPAPGADPERGG